jgi:glycine betaine/proline transport system permease protein
MAEEKKFDVLDPFSSVDLGIGDWADGVKDWASDNREVMQPFKQVINDMIVAIEHAFQSTPPLVMLIIISLIAWQAAGKRVGIIVAACLCVLGLLDPNAWSLAQHLLGWLA